jgi:hypothetical protein
MDPDQAPCESFGELFLSLWRSRYLDPLFLAEFLTRLAGHMDGSQHRHRADGLPAVPEIAQEAC